MSYQGLHWSRHTACASQQVRPGPFRALTGHICRQPFSLIFRLLCTQVCVSCIYRLPTKIHHPELHNKGPGALSLPSGPDVQPLESRDKDLSEGTCYCAVRQKQEPPSSGSWGVPRAGVWMALGRGGLDRMEIQPTLVEYSVCALGIQANITFRNKARKKTWRISSLTF